MNRNDAECQFGLALEYIGQKKFEEARRALESALTLKSSPSADWYFRLGRVCESGKDWQAAQDAYLKALVLRPNSAKCRFQLGQVEMRLNSLSAAEDAYRQALAIEANRPDWHEKLGLCLKAQGRPLEAIQAFKRALPLYALKFKQGDRNIGVEWANALGECEFYEDGLSVLDRSIGFIEPNSKFESVVSLLTDSLGAKGEIHLALKALENLRQIENLKDCAFRQYLKLCVKYAYFEDPALEAAAEARSERCTDLATKETALLLTFLYVGSSLKLVEEFLDVISKQEKLNRPFALHVASMLFRLGEYERLDVFCRRYPELWVYGGETLGIAYFVAHADDAGIAPEKKSVALETLAAYKAVQQAEIDIWKRIGSTNLSLAIVGNSVCEIGRGRGVEIDSHDIVVRFNNFSIETPYDKDYGKKVDVIVRVGLDKPKYNINGYSKDIVISGIRPLDKYNSWSLIRRLMMEGHRVCFFPQKLQQELVHTVRRSPSAGLTTAWVAHHKRQGTGKTSHYGFSFLDQIGHDAQPSHYFESSQPSGRHPWEKEAAIFEKISGHDMKIPAVLPKNQGSRIKLLGDHSKYHAGCAAVMDYLSREVQEIGILSGNDDYDILIVNGEGSMHHDSKNFKGKMAEMEAALGRGKRVYLINTVWQSNGVEYNNILKNLDGISVREQMSHEDLFENHGIRSIVRLDVSYWAEVQETPIFRDLQGAIAVGDFYSKEFGNFVRLTGGPLRSLPYVDMSEFSWSGLVSTLRTASLLVTGRHHAVFAACRARTPFIALEGNTHKIEGMIQMSGLPIPVCKTPGELSQCIKWARKNRDVYDEFFSWMDVQPRFRLGELLGVI